MLLSCRYLAVWMPHEVPLMLCGDDLSLVEPNDAAVVVISSMEAGSSC